MVEVLRNKNQATRLQILVEIANRGSYVQQRDIAAKLEVTPQAISDYVSQLIEDKMLVSEGRASYRITNEGVNWIIKMLRELSDYTAYIKSSITNILTCTAIAESNLKKDQTVALKMVGGLFMASENLSRSGATGKTISSARTGEDVGITDIEGIVSLKVGTIRIMRIPNIQSGGSRKADPNKLKKYLDGSPFTVSLGLEAFVLLRKMGAEFHHYGAVDAAIEAARSGLSPLVVCVENEAADFIARLEKENISQELIDARSA